MSRSYRKPYAAVCGSDSAHDDKKHAARSGRAAHRQALRDLLKSGLYDEFLLPHRYECSFNDSTRGREMAGSISISTVIPTSGSTNGI